MIKVRGKGEKLWIESR